MRISELSLATGVPVATIKFYMRECLLPAGDPVTSTLADYGHAHVQRLRLVRALIDVGGLSVAATAEVVRALDKQGVAMHDVLGAAHHALSRPVPRETNLTGNELAEARHTVDTLIAARGWAVNPSAPARQRLARAIATLRRLDLAADPDTLGHYADAADGLAAYEVATVPEAPREAAALHVVLGTVLYEPVLTALRLLAHEAASARRFAALGKD